MEPCSMAKIMSLGKLAIHRTYLCTLIFRTLPKMLGFTPSSLKKFCKVEHVEIQLTKKTTLGTLPEWPPDILMGIFATLEIPDLVRTGSTPCLLYTSESTGESVACLYSLAEKRSYKLRSSHGWLVTVDDRSEMHVSNHITCEQIALPSVITIKKVNPVVDEYGDAHMYDSPSIFALNKLRHEIHYKAFVFPDTSIGSYIVGDDNWTWLPPYDDYSDCTYKDGFLYVACNYKGELHTFDLNGPVVTRKTIINIPRKYDCEYMYTVQAPWGGLLLICRIFEDHNVEPKPGASVFCNTTQYSVYEFDDAGSELKEINCLRDHVLFLGHNQLLCLGAEEYPSLRANHAYFTDDNSLWACGLKNNHCDMGVLNLDDKSKQDLVSPQLWSNFSAPMWITLDLRKMNLSSRGRLKKTDRWIQ
ncbi:hypothetical protein VPH35_029841 [Triticum aestivum]